MVEAVVLLNRPQLVGDQRDEVVVVDLLLLLGDGLEPLERAPQIVVVEGEA